MKLFKCTNCSHSVYFENTYCVRCNASLGFVAEMLQPIALAVENNGRWSVTENAAKVFYKYCSNHQFGVCNWVIPAESQSSFCKACNLNRTIPNLNKPEYVKRWREIENAKHRLVYQLLRMKLPLESKQKKEQTGLVFDFKANETADEKEKILTGHDNGVITINIAEADDIEREMARKQMDEVYRTLLGHFRHEIGHYYWDRLIGNTDKLAGFRKRFGNETLDYAEALKNYYNATTPAKFNGNYISAYATAHPWEDWAETWAHYLHILDTLETAYSFGLSVHPLVAESKRLHAEMKTDPYSVKDFEVIMDLWFPLTSAMNSLNRSMGLRDIYPFVITAAVKEKMKFIHEVVINASVEAE